jgi:hypothetical protein
MIIFESLGVNILLRKLACAITTSVELKKVGDEYHLLTTSSFKNITYKFKLGEEFEEDVWFGPKVKSIVTLEGENRFVKRELSEIPQTIVREFTETECVITTTRQDVTCKLYYQVVD